MFEHFCLLASFSEFTSALSRLNDSSITSNIMPICAYILPSITTVMLLFYPCNAKGNEAKMSMFVACAACVAWVYLVQEVAPARGQLDSTLLFFGSGFVITAFTLFFCTKFCTFFLIGLPIATFLGGPVGLVGMIMLAVLLTGFGIYVCAYCWLMALISLLGNFQKPGSGNTTIISITIKTVVMLITSIVIFIQEIKGPAPVEQRSALLLTAVVEQSNSKPLGLFDKMTPHNVTAKEYAQITGFDPASGKYRYARPSETTPCVFTITCFNKKWYLSPANSGSFTVTRNGRSVSDRHMLDNGDTIELKHAGGSFGQTRVTIKTK